MNSCPHSAAIIILVGVMSAFQAKASVSTTSQWIPIKDASLSTSTETPTSTGTATKNNYITLKLEGAQIDANATFWTKFLSSQTNVVIKIDMPVSQFNSPPVDIVVTTPSIKINYNQVQQLGQRLSLLYKIPAQAGPIPVRSSLFRTADDGVAAALTQLSGEATNLGVTSSSAMPIAALSVVKNLVDEIITKDLKSEELPSTHTIFPEDAAGLFAVFATDSNNKTNFDKYTLNSSKLTWDGNQLTFPDDSNVPQKLTGVSYFIFRISYASTYYPDAVSIINSDTTYGIIYQQIRSLIAGRVQDAALSFEGTKPDTIAIVKATREAWTSIKPLYGPAADAIRKDVRLCPDDAATYADEVQAYLFKLTHEKFAALASQVWDQSIAAAEVPNSPEMKNAFVTALSNAASAGLSSETPTNPDPPLNSLQILDFAVKSSHVKFIPAINLEDFEKQIKVDKTDNL